jgi:beta-glucosidase
MPRTNVAASGIAAIALLAVLQPVTLAARGTANVAAQPTLGTRSAPVIDRDGLRFRDLDRDGRLAPYEDWRLPPERRAADLVRRMTLLEKAGTMMHGSLPGIGNVVGFSTQGYDFPLLRGDIADRKVTSFITRLAVGPRRMAEENNKVQELAEQTRLGIPLTISTDPRHHFQFVLGATNTAEGYSQWPEPLGFGALRDRDAVRRFADVARIEYRATGIHEALSPQADLFTEPRWARGTGTFGSDPVVVGGLVQAYVEGFQGGGAGLSRNGVMTIVKHWVGYGATPNGWDGHNYYGRFARLNKRTFPLHLQAFQGAFAARVAGVMPTYSILQGVTIDGRATEPVAAGFNKQLLTDLLRKKQGYRGVVLSDWAITNDCGDNCQNATVPHGPQDIAMPWGVERLTKVERFAKGVNAGIDQFGGVSDSALLVEAVRKRMIPMARIDEAVVRVLVPKFQMGLFENPYVDADAADRIVGAPAVMAEARLAQAQSQVLLKDKGLFPIRAGTRVWLKDIDPQLASAHGLVVVTRPEDAEIALVRLSTPSERPHPNYFFGRRQNEGRLDFRAGEPGYELVKSLSGKTKVAVALFADRPAILGEVDKMADAILVNFGVSDDALLDVVTGKVSAIGRLPFELPSSMAAVERQDPALPDDSKDPLYPVGFRYVPR